MRKTLFRSGLAIVSAVAWANCRHFDFTSVHRTTFLVPLTSFNIHHLASSIWSKPEHLIFIGRTAIVSQILKARLGRALRSLRSECGAATLPDLLLSVSAALWSLCGCPYLFTSRLCSIQSPAGSSNRSLVASEMRSSTGNKFNASGHVTQLEQLVMGGNHAI
jgi:hypothetical protein